MDTAHRITHVATLERHDSHDHALLDVLQSLADIKRELQDARAAAKREGEALAKTLESTRLFRALRFLRLI